MTTRDSQEPPPVGYAVEWAEILAALRDPRFWLKLALIVGSVIWIYWPVLNGAALMDDNFYLFKNALLWDPHRLWKAWFEPGSFVEYYPIEQTVQWVQFRFWGFSLLGYHLTNILLHAISALLIWRILSKFGLQLAWIGGLLFAVHPAAVESVAWMAELKNALSLPPLLIAISCYIEYEKHRRPADYFVALAAFIISMLCKIGGAPLPFIFLLYAWWRRDRIGFGDLKAVLPFLLVSVAMVIITRWCGQQFAVNLFVGDLPHPGLLARFALAGGTLVSYFTQAVWPFDLLPIYSQWTVEPPAFVQFWPWPTTVAVAALCWRYRVGWGRHAALGFGFFVLNIAPFLGFVWISYMRFTWVMDHLAYIGLIGLIGLVIALLEILSGRKHSMFAAAGAVAVALGLAWSSRTYAANFASVEVLAPYTIKRNPSAWPLYNNLAAIYILQGHPEKALPLVEKALEINPQYSEASYNRALSLEALDRLPEAVEQYRRTLEIWPSEPEVLFSYARVLQKSGYLEEAAVQYEAGLRLVPDFADARGQLGALLAQIGRLTQAEIELREAIRLDPNGAAYHTDLGNVLFQTGRSAQAIEEYRRALQIDPNLVVAHNDLAGALQHTGHPVEAVDEFEKALKLDPENPWLMVNIASALADAGRKDDAIQILEVALRMSPGYQPALDEMKTLRETKPALAH